MNVHDNSHNFIKCLFYATRNANLNAYYTLCYIYTNSSNSQANPLNIIVPRILEIKNLRCQVMYVTCSRSFM